MNGEKAKTPRFKKVRRGEGWFARKLIREVQTENQNRLVLLTGATGSGKSYGGLRLAELLMAELGRATDERFWLFFDDTEFTDYIYADDIRPLDVILWDDPGITDASQYRQLTRTGQLINLVMQSWRHRNVVLIVATPASQMLNKNIRRFAHYELKPPSPAKRWALPRGFQRGNVDRSRRLSIWDLKAIEYESDDPRSGTDKVYKKYIRELNRKTGEVERIETLTLHHPNGTWTGVYEERKAPEIMAIYQRKIEDARKARPDWTLAAQWVEEEAS